ncbi:hypothetical protein GQ600_22273 [Phytophthora cactorum]|nr:hypothetical protein GQ600_22273 [Phytophthora cactorum]
MTYETSPMYSFSWRRLVHREQISKLNRLLDVALAAYGIPEPRGMATWHAVFQQERQERMARFQIMVANKKLLMQILGDEQQQLEVLTLLAYDFQKHGEDTYTDLEYDVISDVYQTCLRLSGLLVVAVPEWFVPAYEIQQSRWQGIGVDVEYLLNQNEEFCTRRHRPLHESVKKSVSSRDAQLETAHILQSLPNENKVMLHGGELLLLSVISLRVNLKKQQLTTSLLLTSFLKHAE